VCVRCVYVYAVCAYVCVCVCCVCMLCVCMRCECVYAVCACCVCVCVCVRTPRRLSALQLVYRRLKAPSLWEIFSDWLLEDRNKIVSLLLFLIRFRHMPVICPAFRGTFSPELRINSLSHSLSLSLFLSFSFPPSLHSILSSSLPPSFTPSPLSIFWTCKWS
jgi:hypothetical protein